MRLSVIHPLTLAVGLTLSGAAAAQTQERGDPEAARMLNGHQFVRTTLARWAFPTTYFGSTIGGGFLSQSSGDSSLSLVALSQNFDLSLGLFDLVALRGGLTGTMFVGSNLDSALAAGGNLVASPSFGASVRIIRSDSFFLAAAFDGSVTLGKGLNPSILLQGSQEGLLTDLSGYELSPALVAAIGVHELFGIQSSAAFSFGSTKVGMTDVSSKALEVAVSANLDLDAISVPLAFPVTYQLRASFESALPTEHRLEAGVFYSGRTNLDLGALVSTRLGSNSQSEFTGSFRMYYHW
jgi:hypothetical protein